MERYLYLLLDLLSILFPLLFSFYPNAPFYKEWKHVWIALAIPAVVFILWDMLFTHMGIWEFNERYLTGVHIFNLPLEEILFFVCIPYACLFTYFALKRLIRHDYLQRIHKIISVVLCTALIALGIFFIDRWYTSTTFLALAAFLIIQMAVLRPDYMGRFYMAFIVLLIPFLFVNGILTGSFIQQPVVWYNNSENMGVRIGTIPVEDTFYGMLLILMNVSVFEWLKRKGHEGTTS